MYSLKKIKKLAGPYFPTAMACSWEYDKKGRRKDCPQRKLSLLGDAVLRAVIVEILIKLNQPMPVAVINDQKVSLECGKHLKIVGEKLGLAKAMKMAKGQVAQVDVSIRLIAETVEAVIAAIYLHSGHEAAKSFVVANVVEPFASLFR